MNDLVFDFHQIEVRNVELPHGAQRQLKRLVAVRPSRGAQLLAELSQGAEDARPVETLPFAMFAVIHSSALHNRRACTWSPWQSGSVAYIARKQRYSTRARKPIDRRGGSDGVINSRMA